MHAFDSGSDGVTDLTAPIPALFAQAFATGVDFFMPAASPATGKVSVVLRSRGGGPARTINLPNFPSTTDRVTVLLNDYENELVAESVMVPAQPGPWLLRRRSS